MKKLTVLFVIAIVALFVYRKYSSIVWDTKPDTTPDYVNHPVRPKDIPETTRDGTPIEWNWKKQRAYENHKLWVIRDSAGKALGILIQTN